MLTETSKLGATAGKIEGSTTAILVEIFFLLRQCSNSRIRHTAHVVITEQNDTTVIAAIPVTCFEEKFQRTV